MKGNKRAAFCKNKIDEEVLRFALHDGTKDDFIDEQETVRTPEYRQIETYDIFSYFKTEFVPFSLQVFILHKCKHLQIRDAIHKFKNLISKI